MDFFKIHYLNIVKCLGPEILPLTFILSPLKRGEGKGEGFSGWIKDLFRTYFGD
jgi:hypothetical protein